MRLENLGGKLRHDRFGPDLGLDALDLDQELRGLLNQLIRLGREPVRQRDTDIGAALGLPGLPERRRPQRLLGEAGRLAGRHLGDIHRILGIGEIQLGVELGLEPRLDDVGPLLDQGLRHHHEAAVALVDRGAGRYPARQLPPGRDAMPSAPRSRRRRASSRGSRW